MRAKEDKGAQENKVDKVEEQVLPVNERTEQCSQRNAQEITGHIQ